MKTGSGNPAVSGGAKYTNLQSRPGHFSLVGLWSLIAGLPSVLTSATLIDEMPWASIYIGLGFLLLSLGLVMLLALHGALSDSFCSPNQETDAISTTAPGDIQYTIRDSVHWPARFIKFIFFRSWSVACVLMASMVLPGGFIIDLELQYAKRRFGWIFSQVSPPSLRAMFLTKLRSKTTYLRALYIFVTILVVFNFSGPWKYTNARNIAAGSAAACALATFLIWLASERWMFILGTPEVYGFTLGYDD